MSVDALKQMLHAQGRMRVWSVIVSIIGDVAAPMGGKISMVDLIDLCAIAGIESQAVRTAMSRLSKENWVIGERQGRSAHYRFADQSRADYVRATALIYAPPEPNDGQRWQTALIPHSGPNRAAILSCFDSINAVVVGQQLAFWPDSAKLPDGLAADLLPVQPDWASAPVGAKSSITPEIDRDHCATLSNIASSLAQSPPQSPREALVARFLLIHFWRRLVLRAPMIHAPLPEDIWPLPGLQRAVATAYPRLVEVCAGLDGYAVDLDMLKSRFT